MNTNFLIIGAVIATAFALGLGLIIGHFGITKKTSGTSWKYNRLTRPADPKNYRTFIDSIEAANIEANLKNLTSRSHMAGLLEDLESAQVIEEQWKLDGLQVTQPKYNVLLSYPDDSELNRHIIYALAKGNPYAATGCPAVSDVIASGNSTEITNPIAVATYFVHGILSVLKEVHNFFSSY
ncbi:unnamed protein product [Rotaria sp. Silwood1]|nr:unnamed protein product [Rotaria sp. Silwood1]